jgi:glyoxylase-like metal-dependent hydrolase (beta-lactamase superfamily II)
MATGDIVLISGEHGARFPDGNTLFVDDEVPTVIDPATRRPDLERIDAEKGVAIVINTHYHIDHIRYNKLFGAAELLAHPADAPAIESIEGMARMVGIEDRPWLDIWRVVMTEQWGYEPMPVTRKVVEGDEVCLGENTVRFVHVPGHTPGNMCLHFLERNAVYLADIDLTPFGPWYGNRYSDIDAFLVSIERVKTLGADLWYTAHGQGLIAGDITARLDAFAHVVDQREGRILDFLSSPRSFEEIVDAALVYGKRWEPAEMFDYFEGTMLGKHLERMERSGTVKIEDGAWRAT